MYIRKRGIRKRVSDGSTEEVNRMTVPAVYMVMYDKHLSNCIFTVAYTACMISSIVVRSYNDMYGCGHMPLADNSEALYGIKCYADMVAKYKSGILTHAPLAYRKERYGLPPLAGGKVLPGTIVKDQLGHGMMKNPASMANLAEAVAAGSKIKVLLSLSSL